MNNNMVRKIIDECLTELYHNSSPRVEFNDVKKAFAEGDIDSLVERSIITEEQYLRTCNVYRKKLPYAYTKLFIHTLLMYRPRIQKKDGELY
jgi:hypothetical protein